MPGKVIHVATADGRDFDAYFAVPDAGSGPGILLLHEDDVAVRQFAELYAAEGYVVLSPHRVGAPDEVAAAAAALRRRPECAGKIAVLGFGRGGLDALCSAAANAVDAAVCYDAAPIDAAPGATEIRCPVVLHFAERDPAASPEAVMRFKEAVASHPQIAVHIYPGTQRGFAEPNGANYDRAAAGLAHSRSIALLRQALGPHYDLENLWEAHVRYEFETRDVAATMATMVPEPYVNHIPVMTGGVGARDLARFYANHFIPKLPKDTKIVPVSRTIGADRIVDEMLTSFTHDVEIDWMLPGVPPTGRRVVVPIVAIVGFRGDKLYHEHIYWDQASVLVQIGLIDPKGLPVAGAEAAAKLADETLPSNTLMKRWAESAPHRG